MLDAIENRVQWPKETMARLLFTDLRNEQRWEDQKRWLREQAASYAETVTARWEPWPEPQPDPFALFPRRYREYVESEVPRRDVHVLRQIQNPIRLWRSGYEMLRITARCETCRRRVEVDDLDVKHSMTAERAYWDNEPIRGRGTYCEDVLRERFGVK